MSKWSWFGGRATLLLNLSVLALALSAIFPTEYSYRMLVGSLKWSPVLSCLLPAIVAFMVRSKPVSMMFLALYIALSVQFWLQARDLYLGTFVHRTMKSPIEWVSVVDGIALIVLTAYLGFFLFVAAVAFIAKRMN